MRLQWLYKQTKRRTSAIVVFVVSLALLIPMGLIGTVSVSAAGVTVGSGATAAATGWQKIGGDWFYLDQGVPLKGEQTIGGDSYYFTTDTGVRYSGWRKLSNGRYVFYGGDGKKYNGGKEVKIGSAWYYLEPKTGYRHTGWARLSSQTYKYYAPDGRRLTSTHMINGRRYWFDSTGATDKYGWQNPPQYFQVSRRSVKFNRPAPWNYATPSRLRVDANRNEAVEVMIRRAYEYMGTPYIWNYALAPGQGVDCAGLVMQSLYATGMNLDGYNPYNHWYDPYHSHDANNMAADKRFQHVSLEARKRGDLIFYTGHVAIYLGNNQVIEAYVPRVRVANIFDGGRRPTAIARPFV
ncbi:hypothetical protein GFD17_01020 [Bifidobacterium sp. SMB2]|uniref:NlpC/P60 domain-containing protein n=1 Tax=Bifidobacterium saimiriisciurei TaxID=2661627 RepID=A0ABX0CAP0_9BIFI|nr:MULTISPECIES: NlpC/P60 family protein [Bifidobacterium]NEG95359.1 hypothetical protein [Bifidobacterium sp. SMB2]NEH11457.1 hypothetical protein [Bifidobacterium saimiriisciurei]